MSFDVKAAGRRLRLLTWSYRAISHDMITERNFEMANYNLLEERALLARTVAEEGIVLLKNENNVLPLSSEKVAVFGRSQIDTIKCGTGSAYCESEYMVDILTGLEEAGVNVDGELASQYRAFCAENPLTALGVWGTGAHINPEMPMTKDTVKMAAQRTDAAIVIFGRTAGENDDIIVTEGDYMLSFDEKKLLERVCRYFKKIIVVVNSGNLIDFDFSTNNKVNAVVLLNLPGMEGGNALANVLTGKVTPSGKLTDTIAKTYDDYPSASYFGKKSGIIQNYYEDIFVGYRYFETFENAKDRVLYPFGFGLSYTQFEIKCTNFECDKTVDGDIRVTVSVKNIGDTYAGKEVVMLYSSSPAGKLGTPKYELRAFAKTSLLAPGAEETLTLTYKISDMMSFDDTGVLGTKDAWVMDQGTYTVSLGNNVRTLTAVGTFENPEYTVFKTCVHMPTELDKRLTASGEMEELETLPIDLEAGIPVDAFNVTTIEAEQHYGREGNRTVYRLHVASTGVYTVIMKAKNAMPASVVLNRFPVADPERFFTEKGDETVLNLGTIEYVFTSEEGTEAPLVELTLIKDDTPVEISATEPSYVQAGRYTECGLWVANRPFFDEEGVLTHGRALSRMHSPGRYAQYKLDVKKAGKYDVRLRFSNKHEALDLHDTFSFFISNVTQDIEHVVLEHTTDDEREPVYVTTKPFSVVLPKGETFFKIVSKSFKTPITSYLEFVPSKRRSGVKKKSTVQEDTKVAENANPIVRRALPEAIGEMDFRRVMNGTLSMDDFVNSLSDSELAVLSCGNAEGWIGYIPEKGIPEAYWSDGPVGLRQPFKVTVYPSSTMVSATWNTALSKEYGRAIAHEAKLYNVDVWLAPAMNIHRDPCCGRNFEYHSEDPYITAKIVSGMVEGCQEYDLAATIKHFAANSTEYQRLRSNSRLSARAFREIYAKAFEIVIREANPHAIMTSYNFINGIKVCEDPMICKTIMRDEFNYKGLLMTDYGNDSVHVRELAAEHDLKMHFGDPRSVNAALEDGSLSRESVRTCVKRVLELIWKTAGKKM